MERSPRLALALVAVVLAAAACAGGPVPTGSPGPSPSPAGDLTAAEMKLSLLDALGSPWYCDPDAYPVGRDEAAAAAVRFPEVRMDAEAFAAITAALGIDPAKPSFSPDEQLAIYRQWKVLAAIELTPADGGLAFDELFGPTDAAGQAGERITGTIAADGTVDVARREPSGPPNCPICLARGTTILGPAGAVAVEALAVGDTVWTLDAAGRRVAGTVLVVASSPVPDTHRVVRVVLADGRAVTASPGHPLADGRALGELRAGDRVDGSRVVDAALVSYAGGRTFDLVVSGPTGTYLAGDGIALASTIGR